MKCVEVRARLYERRANEDIKIKGEVKMRAKHKRGERESSAESRKVCVGEGIRENKQRGEEGNSGTAVIPPAAGSEHREESEQERGERRRAGNSYQLLNSRLQSTEA